jgi:hypothetical protein
LRSQESCPWREELVPFLVFEEECLRDIDEGDGLLLSLRLLFTALGPEVLAFGDGGRCYRLLFWFVWEHGFVEVNVR